MAKIIGASGNTYIGGNVEIGGTVTAGATASVAPTISITASTGAIAANGLVTAGGGVKTVTPVDVNAAWDSGSSTFFATMNTVGGVIAIDFSAHTVAAAFAGTQTLIVTNSALDLTSRIHITLDYDGALTKMPVFRMERRNGEFELVFFNAGSAAIDDVVLVQFDIINPA
jgi:hypothetical protein